MISFFRKSRKQSADDNQLVKYSRYAIGEIVLVVIGILIALQINNWNEKQKAKQKERTILENILQDLKNDQIGLNAIIERRTSKAVSAEVMVSYYNGAPIEKLSDYYFHWTNVLYWEFHHPRNITFEELVNSGNVSIIENAQIKDLLLDINATYDELFEVRKHMYDDYALYLYEPYSGIIDYGTGIEVWSNPKTSIVLSEEDVAVALKNKAIKNGFTLAAFNNTGLKNQLLDILKKVEATIALIDEELGQ